MAKYKQFYSSLRATVDNTDTIRLKAAIGDSTNNHRTPTVSQVIRFLNRKNSSKNQRQLGKKLRNIYPMLRTTAKNFRNSNRTDAIDINEFLYTYFLDVVCLKRKQRKISRVL